MNEVDSASKAREVVFEERTIDPAARTFFVVGREVVKKFFTVHLDVLMHNLRRGDIPKELLRRVLKYLMGLRPGPSLASQAPCSESCDTLPERWQWCGGRWHWPSARECGCGRWVWDPPGIREAWSGCGRTRHTWDERSRGWQRSSTWWFKDN